MVQKHTDGQRAAPSEGDMFWGEGAGGYNPAGLLASFSKEVGDWIARSIITQDDVNFIINEMAAINAVRRGSTDVQQLIWYYLGLNVSVEGQGRKQVENVLIGTRLQRQNFVPMGLLDRMRKPDGSKESS